MTETSTHETTWSRRSPARCSPPSARRAGAGAGGRCRGDPCRHLHRRAAPPQCATKVRDVVAGGATRVEYHGRAADVPGDLARYIDHTLLRPDASAADIDKLCARGRRVPLRRRLHQPDLGPPRGREPARHGRRRRLRHRLPVRGRDERGQGRRGAPGDPRRRPRDRHGHQHRGPQERDARRGPRRHRPASRTPAARPARRTR